MPIVKSSGETLCRYRVESFPLPEGVSVVRRVRFEESHQDGKKVTSETTTHQFVVAKEDLASALSGKTPSSAAQIYLLDPELMTRIPTLLDSSPAHLDAAARTQGLAKHNLTAFHFPFSTAEKQGPYCVCRWDAHYGWFDLAADRYLAQPILMSPKTGMTAQNYAFKRLLTHLEGRDDVLFAGREGAENLTPLADRDGLFFHYCPDQDTYNSLVQRSKQLVQDDGPADLAYAVFDLDPLKLYDAGALKIATLDLLMGRFEAPNKHRAD